MAELDKKGIALKHQTAQLNHLFGKHWEAASVQYENTHRLLRASDPKRLLSCGLFFPVQESTKEIQDVRTLRPGDDHCFLHKSGCYKMRVLEKVN